MFHLRGLLTLALLCGLVVPTLAAPAGRKGRNRRQPNHTVRGRIVSVHAHAGRSQNGALTIRVHRRQRGRGRSTRAALRRSAGSGGMYTFRINPATRIERNGRGSLPLRSLHRGEYVLVVASGGTARVVDVLASGGGRRHHSLVRRHRPIGRSGLTRRSPRFVRRRVARAVHHPLAHHSMAPRWHRTAHAPVYRSAVARSGAVHRPGLRHSVTTHKPISKHPPRPVARKPARPPAQHALSKPKHHPKPAHPPAHHASHNKNGHKR